MKKIIALLSVLSSTAVFGFGGEQSSVQTKTNVVGENLEIEVLVKPNAGLHVTKEGPWSVTFTQAPGLNLQMDNGKYVNKTFDEKIPGFKIQAPIDSKAKSGKIDYLVRAFICTDDKKQCFPQQHKGTIDWKRS